MDKLVGSVAVTVTSPGPVTGVAMATGSAAVAAKPTVFVAVVAIRGGPNVECADGLSAPLLLTCLDSSVGALSSRVYAL